jgi:hypothetical protein
MINQTGKGKNKQPKASRKNGYRAKGLRRRWEKGRELAWLGMNRRAELEEAESGFRLYKNP